MNWIRIYWCRIDADEEGAAMTEFILVLPIFLFLFGGILSLGSLTNAAVKSHTDAAHHVWEEVYAAEDEWQRMSPLLTSFNETNSLGDLIDNILGGSPGNWSESNRAVSVEMPAATGKTVPSETPDGTPIFVTSSPQDIIGNSHAGRVVADDSSGLGAALNLTGLQGSLSGGLLGMALNELINALGIHHGMGAGTRYGSVEAGLSRSVDPGYGLPTANYSVYYSSLVSPSPESGMSIPFLNRWLNDASTRSFATARVMVETEQPYRQLFNIYDTSSNRLNRNASNNVPELYD